MYSKEFEPVMNAVAASLKMNPLWLYKVIMLESSWNPTAYNKSGAVGLIQFMPKTLKDYGILSAQLAAKIPTGSAVVPENVKQEVRTEFLAKYPDVISQLQGPVLKYFKRYYDYPTEQSVYMTVFYPSYRNAPLTEPFSAAVQAQNPGVKTVGDYVALVQSRVRTKDMIAKATSPLSLMAVAAIGLTGYFVMRT